MVLRDYQYFKSNDKSPKNVFMCYVTCQQKALSVTYSADRSVFSLSEILGGCQTAANIFAGIYLHFFNLQ